MEKREDGEIERGGDAEMSEAEELNLEQGVSDSEKPSPWRIAFAVASVTLLLVAAWFTSGGIGDGPYGFDGRLYRYGEQGHALYLGEAVEEDLAEKLGAFLLEAGYFSSDYPGVVQLERGDAGYRVSLSYSQAYWSREDFLEDVDFLKGGMEDLVFQVPTQVILVDEDDSGVHRKQI